IVVKMTTLGVYYAKTMLTLGEIFNRNAMLISVFVPEYGVIEAVTPPFRSFNTANDFLTTFGKEPVFQVEYVGLNEYVPANNGEYTIKTNRLLKDVATTDLLFIPPTFGDTGKGLQANAEAI